MLFYKEPNRSAVWELQGLKDLNTCLLSILLNLFNFSNDMQMMWIYYNYTYRLLCS